MTASDLRYLVDDLAQHLDTPTQLEDRELRLIAYSAQTEAVDDIRRNSILLREASPEVKVWFRQFGIQQATEPMRIPRYPDIGILGRLCIPVRYGRRTMGYLWLIDDEERLDEVAVAAAKHTADQIATLMREQDLAWRLHGGLLSNLLSPSEEMRDVSARRIFDELLFPADASALVIVLRPSVEGGRDLHEVISEALWDGEREADPATVLRLARKDHGVLLMPVTAGDLRAVTPIAERARTALLDRIGNRGKGRVIVAQGDPQRHLSHAIESYRQARLAARVATIDPTVGDSPRWETLGAYRLLVDLPADRLVEASLDHRVRRLLGEGKSEFIETLETYLDLACDVKKTVERLHVHRGTLYYRLAKIERLTGIDLSNGNDRLAIHLSLKLHKLISYRPDSA